ncbi:hypothetical protein [Vibrio parahaemolyticus]|uniref:hypothetical protein n=1 Tax=Vibrio parahaemolyticus TaxID=670 RepID=UPI0005B51992|nr:hypothetical protein [Vibrio parahaemolyticus]OQT82924.1 hypothetical protein EM98_000080 [Vibrio parahaemolyticus]
MSKKLLSEMIDEIESLLKIDYNYYVELLNDETPKDIAWLRAMARYFLSRENKAFSEETAYLLADIIYDEHHLLVNGNHSSDFENAKTAVVENINFKRIELLDKYDFDFEVDEHFSALLDKSFPAFIPTEELKKELARREREEYQAFDEKLRSDLETLDNDSDDFEICLKTIDEDIDNMDFGNDDDFDLDFDDEDIDFDDDFDERDINIDDGDLYFKVENRFSDLFYYTYVKVKFGNCMWYDSNKDILELIRMLDKTNGTNMVIEYDGEEYFYNYEDTSIYIHLFRYLKKVSDNTTFYNQFIKCLVDNYKSDTQTFFSYLNYFSEIFEKNEWFSITKKLLQDELAFGNRDWNEIILQNLISSGYVDKRIRKGKKEEYRITEKGRSLIG